MISRPWKPWFVYRPSQLVRRVRSNDPPVAGFHPIETAWGGTLLADATRTISHSISTTGMFDLAVSEAIARLVPSAGIVVDAGANVGYMSVLAAMAAGPRGRIESFEPHPALLSVLRLNAAASAHGGRSAPITVHASALGDRTGTARLLLPEEFASNDGTARVVESPEQSGQTVAVPLMKLDDAIGEVHVDLLKMDVEGFEAQVLAGADRAIASQRIRHIVFEDHDVERSAVVQRLRDAGYHLFALGWTLRRLRVEPLMRGGAAHSYEAPSFIATTDVDGLVESCRSPGWRTLRRGLGRE
ncbi:MAG: FkbM family methyltransferase [Acidimicrobiia bacterium]|nr:FkbM family methyltransferase [Acidimicrobiia bacterium]